MKQREDFLHLKIFLKQYRTASNLKKNYNNSKKHVLVVNL